MEFTLKATFKATPEQLYTTWLSSEGHSKMTGGAAVISDSDGAEFSTWDGYIEGKNITLEPYKRIVQSWRTSQFDENEPDSTLELLFEEVEEQTALTLIHTNVPEGGEHYLQGWDNHYFQPMKVYFDQ